MTSSACQDQQKLFALNFFPTLMELVQLFKLGLIICFQIVCATPMGLCCAGLFNMLSVVASFTYYFYLVFFKNCAYASVFLGMVDGS